MGLDIVELIMRAEEEFEIEIPDADAEMLSTPGALCDYVENRLAALRTYSSSSCPTSLAFYTVRRELMQLGIERRHVTPQTSLETLWPRSERSHNWDALGKALHFELPSLRRSSGWAFVGLLLLSVFPIWLLLYPTTAIAAFSFYGVAWWLGCSLTRPFAVHAPAAMRSVADLSRTLAPRFSASAGASSQDIWQQVRAIVADECGEPLEKVTRDADFIRDLGMG